MDGRDRGRADARADRAEGERRERAAVTGGRTGAAGGRSASRRSIFSSIESTISGS